MVGAVIFMAGTRLNRLHLEEWLRKKSGISKNYFKGDPYKQLQAKVKSAVRYARSDVKNAVRIHPFNCPSSRH